jgi:hypothetical protein
LRSSRFLVVATTLRYLCCRVVPSAVLDSTLALVELVDPVRTLDGDAERLQDYVIAARASIASVRRRVSLDSFADDVRGHLRDVKRGVTSRRDAVCAWLWLPAVWAAACVVTLVSARRCTCVTRCLALLAPLVVAIVSLSTALLFVAGIAASDVCVAPEAVVIAQADAAHVSTSTVATMAHCLTCDRLAVEVRWPSVAHG